MSRLWFQNYAHTNIRSPGVNGRVTASLHNHTIFPSSCCWKEIIHPSTICGFWGNITVLSELTTGNALLRYDKGCIECPWWHENKWRW
jgi:hypothetical protein